MDEDQGLDEAAAIKRKPTRRERLKGAVQRGVGKIKRNDQESTADGDFTLNDDVKDFLAGRPTTPSKPPTLQSPRPQPNSGDKEAASLHIDGDDFLHKSASSVASPPFSSPSRVSKPRIDISKSQRFPGARDLLDEKQDKTLVSALHVRSQSHSPQSQRARRKELAVRFTNDSPIVIGEGGDEAEAPTQEISRLRARSHSPMLERPIEPPGVPQPQILRKPVAAPSQRPPPKHELPLSLKILTRDTSPMHSNAETSLSGSAQGLSPEVAPPTPISPGSPYAPVSGTRLRMRAEEGKTLRESFLGSPNGSVPD